VARGIEGAVALPYSAEEAKAAEYLYREAIEIWADEPGPSTSRARTCSTASGSDANDDGSTPAREADGTTSLLRVRNGSVRGTGTRRRLEANRRTARKRMADTLGELTPQGSADFHLARRGTSKLEIAPRSTLHQPARRVPHAQVFASSNVKTRTQRRTACEVDVPEATGRK